MIRLAESVLPGHPDKFCDQVADAIVAACAAAEPEAYCQVEVAAWCDTLCLTGSYALEGPRPFEVEPLVHAVTDLVGYRTQDGHGPLRFRVQDATCFEQRDPRPWTREVNDQAICVGWAGYDAHTDYLPPEHFLAHVFRRALWSSTKGGHLRGAGPDGKILLRVREEADGWHLEHVLVTLQHQPQTSVLDLSLGIDVVLRTAYEALQAGDPRWRRPWSEVVLMVNPNGPLPTAGTFGDNGQTGRKLAMDYYGPRVGQGGGALSGKHLTHIDRLGSLAARQAAIQAVATGARNCRILLTYAPNVPEPLEVVVEMEGRGERPRAGAFHFAAMLERLGQATITEAWAQGGMSAIPRF